MSDPVFVEIRWQLSGEHGPENGTWRRDITTGHVGDKEMQQAVNAAIKTIRNELGVKAP